MEQKIRGFLSFIFSNFGPIIVFYGVNHFWGLKPAIAVSTAFSVIEIGYKVFRKQPLSGIFIFSAAMTFIFGAIDLYSQQSYLFKYEAAITNLFSAVFFGATLFSEKTIIQDYYQKSKNAKPMTRDRVVYFQILTSVWVLYFLAKSATYYWIAQTYSLEQGLVVRTILGSGSLYVMLFISIVGSKKIFPLLKQWGVFPKAEPVT